MVQRSIVWFKSDLRLEDNETLVRALEKSEEIIPVYCFDENHYRTTEFGFQKTGKFRAQFLLESLAELDANLRQLGSGLLIVRGKPEEELFKIASEFKAQKIFAKKEVAYEEVKAEERVEKELWKLSCTLETYSTSTLYHAEDLPFSIKDIPDVFTSFRKKVEKECSIRPVFAKPVSIKSPALPAVQLPSLADLGLQPPVPDGRSAMPFPGGETAARQRMQSYFYKTRAIDSYKETRNGMIGEGYSTKFSAWLSAGCLSARGIYVELKKYEEQYAPSKSTYWLVFELLWRDYFRFMMKKYRRRFFLQNGIRNNEISLPEHDEEQLNNWINGQTGNAFINANMIELKRTGYLSNRGRQNVASYLCNDLKVEWRYGAAYFEQQLIDYDVSSNWGNWAYLAGVGNDPRGKRYFNTEKQAGDYDPNGAYTHLWQG